MRLLKESDLLLAIPVQEREAPFYGIPTINLGDRQNNRADGDSIFNVDFITDEIVKTIMNVKEKNSPKLKILETEQAIINSYLLWRGTILLKLKFKNFIDFVSNE